jgi:hypothetical protein
MINPKLFIDLNFLKQVKINDTSLTAVNAKASNGYFRAHYENYLKDAVTLTRGDLDQMINQYIEESSNENLEKLKFVRMKYKSCIENNLNTESKFELIQNKLDFVRNKYELCIKEATEKKSYSESNDSPNIQALKTAEVIKENSNIIRNSYSFADVIFDFADNQILEAHRHILEGELHIFVIIFYTFFIFFIFSFRFSSISSNG